MNTRLRFALALAIAVVAGACADSPAGPLTAVEVLRGPDGNITAGTCTTKQELDRLARLVYGTRQPDISSALGKIKTMDSHVRKGNLSNAIASAHDLVDFTLKKLAQGTLVAPENTVALFINSVFCYAGLDISINVPSNSHLIFPSDVAQARLSGDEQAGVSLPANPVSEPTLMEFQQIPDNFPTPGDGPLDTKLDQYPGFLAITISSEHDAPLLRPVVVGICATGAIPQEVRDRLRIGHGATDGFEITPAANAGFLDCENLTASADQSIGSRILDRLASLVLPEKAHARRQEFGGGGVGGTVGEFSPFAPVDPELRAGGGVGGTVGEFTQSFLVAAVGGSASSHLGVCDPIVGNAFQLLRDACRPFVRVTTRLGTPFVNVPVTWTRTVGNGYIAPLGATCGSLGLAPLIVSTDLFGSSAICWELGAAGANQVIATPNLGGEAVPGVTFVPTSVTFNATAAGAPTQLLVVAGNGQTAQAGSAVPVAPRVRVTDAAGVPVAGVPVHFQVYSGGGSVGAASVVTDPAGYASTSWTVAAGVNEIKVSINAAGLVYHILSATGTTP